MKRYSEVDVAEIPESDADWPTMLEFALTYAGFRRICKGLPQLGRFVQPVLDELRETGKAPDWAGVDLLRASLFYIQRVRHMPDSYGPDAEVEFRALIEGIRRSRGKSVLVRDRDSA
jgi:hypothetical protein